MRLNEKRNDSQGSPTKGAQVTKQIRSERKQVDHYVKILLLGDSGVGKTSLLKRFADKNFSPSTLSTTGVDYKTHYARINGKRVKCQVWDTAGQERFHVITRAYYRGAHGIVLVYDVTDKNTLENIGYWMDSIQKHASSSVEKILVANKVDLPGRLESKHGEEIAKAHGVKYIETSAKTGSNVQAAFIGLAKDIIERNATGTGTSHEKASADVTNQQGSGKPGKCSIL